MASPLYGTDVAESDPLEDPVTPPTADQPTEDANKDASQRHLEPEPPPLGARHTNMLLQAQKASLFRKADISVKQNSSIYLPHLRTEKLVCETYVCCEFYAS